MVETCVKYRLAGQKMVPQLFYLPIFHVELRRIPLKPEASCLSGILAEKSAGIFSFPGKKPLKYDGISAKFLPLML